MLMREYRIVHIITGLSVGGAEMMLYKLLKHMDQNQFQSSVVSLSSKDPIGIKIEQLGIPVIALDLSSHRPNLFKLFELVRVLNVLQPDIVQTWMYHADLVGAVTVRWMQSHKPNVIWNVRHSDFDPAKEKVLTRLVVRACSYLSHHLPKRIICNSHKGAYVHKKIGYCADKIEVIQNGFDLDLFKPSNHFYAEVRENLKIPQDSRIIGMVARYHYQKNHSGFFKAARLIHQYMPDVHFVLCGKNIDLENELIRNDIDRYGIGSCVHLLGQQEEMQELNAGLDIAVSNSIVGEGFPNVIGEAMACGTPCVVTDVGDSGALVGEAGITIPQDDPDALAKACIKLLEMDGPSFQELGRKAQSRIHQHFSIKRIAKKYEQLYLSFGCSK